MYKRYFKTPRRLASRVYASCVCVCVCVFGICFSIVLAPAPAAGQPGLYMCALVVCVHVRVHVRVRVHLSVYTVDRVDAMILFGCNSSIREHGLYNSPRRRCVCVYVFCF